MKKILPIIILGLTSAAVSPVKADLHHRMSSSVALEVNAAHTSVTRAGNTFSISGNNVTTTVTPSGGSAGASLGGISAMSNAGVATFTVPDATQTVAGNAFSYTNALTTGDAIVTTAPATGAVTGYSNQYSVAAGDEDDLLAGSVTSAHAFSGVHAGGAGTTATSQFVSELTIR